MKNLKRSPATTLTRLQSVSAQLYRVPGWGGRRANKSGTGSEFTLYSLPARRVLVLRRGIGIPVAPCASSSARRGDWRIRAHGVSSNETPAACL